MTNQEFSNEFDVLYNNIASNQAPGLNEYEKSVFLTKAQNEIVKNYFTDRKNGNKYEQGFEGSQKRFIDFSKLVTVNNNCPIPFNCISILYDVTDSGGNQGKFSLKINAVTMDGVESITPAFMSLPEILHEIRTVQFKITDIEDSSVSLSDGVLSIVMDSTEGYYNTTSFTTALNTLLSEVSESLVAEVDYVTIESEYQGDTITFDVDVDLAQYKIADRSILIDYPKDFFLFISAECTLEDTSTGKTVIRQQLPIDFKEYIRIMSKPYRNGLKRQILSISSNPRYEVGGTLIINGESYSAIPTTEVGSAIELILPYNSVFKQYRLRYVRYPQPIILEDLTEAELSIQGVSTASECELNEEIHPEILQRAVELAKMAYIADIKDVNVITSMGSRNE